MIGTDVQYIFEYKLTTRKTGDKLIALPKV
jgi:hypothetical protein